MNGRGLLCEGFSQGIGIELRTAEQIAVRTFARGIGVRRVTLASLANVQRLGNALIKRDQAHRVLSSQFQ
jgi:hypothetical protein